MASEDRTEPLLRAGEFLLGLLDLLGGRNPQVPQAGDKRISVQRSHRSFKLLFNVECVKRNVNGSMVFHYALRIEHSTGHRLFHL